MSEQDFYKVLQVDPDADADVIAAAFGVLSGKLNPRTDQTGVHEVRLAELNRAYLILRDRAARLAYDKKRNTELVAMGPGDNGHDYQRLGSGSLTERVQAGPNGEHVDSLTISFGRYAGWTLGALVRQDPDYLRWLSRHSSGIRYRAAILKLLGEQEEQHASQAKR
ncbi:MAG: DnaJ domain-containing protein [Chloroflexota bacterium]